MLGKAVLTEKEDTALPLPGRGRPGRPPHAWTGLLRSGGGPGFTKHGPRDRTPMYCCLSGRDCGEGRRGFHRRPARASRGARARRASRLLQHRAPCPRSARGGQHAQAACGCAPGGPLGTSKRAPAPSPNPAAPAPRPRAGSGPLAGPPVVVALVQSPEKSSVPSPERTTKFLDAHDVQLRGPAPLQVEHVLLQLAHAPVAASANVPAGQSAALTAVRTWMRDQGE